MKTKTLATIIAFLLLPASAQARPTLEQGDKGTDVQNLNKALAKLSYLPANKVSGTYTAETFHGVMAYQKIRGLTRDGVAGPQTRKALKASAAASSRPRPRINSSAKKWIEIDKNRQVVRLVVKGKVKRTISTSTGKPGNITPNGDHTIIRKVVDEYSRTYGNAPMPYSSYWYGGYALHGAADVPGGGNGFGASHGCARIPLVYAPEVYAFATIRTPVYVR